MNGLRISILALISIVLLSSQAYALDCRLNAVSAENPRYDCLYDTPGGEQLIGPGKEVLESYQQTFDDGALKIVRHADIVQTGIMSYSVQNTAMLKKEVVVSYYIYNVGNERAADILVEQEIKGGIIYGIHAGALAPGENRTISFAYEGENGLLLEPEIDYTLTVVSAQFSNVTVDDSVVLKMTAGGRPLANTEVEVTSPAGIKFKLRSDAEGLASFKAREIGQYLMDVPHREFSSPVYIYAMQGGYVAPEAEKTQSVPLGSGATAFLVGGASTAKSIVTFLGPVGLATVLLLFVLAGWSYYRMKHPSERGETLVGGDVPSELARYREDTGQYAGAGLPPDALATNEPLSLTDEQKLKLLESAVVLSPKQRGDLHSKKARKALKGSGKKAHARKGRAG